MNVEQAAGYSPDKIYGQLTSPFLNKMVHINAHPSAEQADDSAATVSLSNFIPTKASARVNVSEITSIGSAKAQEINEGSFPPDPSDTTSSHRLTDFSSSNIVSGALKKGYSAKEAIVISNAAKSYANASRIGVANILSTHAHRN